MWAYSWTCSFITSRNVIFRTVRPMSVTIVAMFPIEIVCIIIFVIQSILLSPLQIVLSPHEVAQFLCCLCLIGRSCILMVREVAVERCAILWMAVRWGVCRVVVNYFCCFYCFILISYPSLLSQLATLSMAVNSCYKTPTYSTPSTVYPTPLLWFISSLLTYLTFIHFIRN